VRYVRASSRLANSESGDHFALDGWLEPALSLGLVSEAKERRSGNSDVGPDPCRHAARATAGEFLEKDGLVDDSSFGPTVSGRIFQPEEVERGEAAEELTWKLLCFLPGLDLRSDLLLDEAPYTGPKLIMLRPKEVRAPHATPSN
jgi:hypothetical protein